MITDRVKPRTTALVTPYSIVIIKLIIIRPTTKATPAKRSMPACTNQYRRTVMATKPTAAYTVTSTIRDDTMDMTTVPTTPKKAINTDMPNKADALC
jgi:hypothetical protein